MPQTRTEGLAIASLVLGIVGLVACQILIPSILAIVLGNQAKTKIATDPNLEGEGLARAGVLIGWIGVGLIGLVLLAIAFVVAFSVATGS